jgi:hypothetical protein
MKYGGFPFDLRTAAGLSEVKVTRPDGSVYYQDATIFEKLTPEQFNHGFPKKETPAVKKKSRSMIQYASQEIHGRNMGRPRDPNACSKATLWRRKQRTME